MEKALPYIIPQYLQWKHIPFQDKILKYRYSLWKKNAKIPTICFEQPIIIIFMPQLNTIVDTIFCEETHLVDDNK